MRCPACGNEEYKRIDYALVQCTRCGGLWDALMYPGFPVLNVEWGAIWDTLEPINEDFDNFDVGGEDEDPDIEKEFDDWGGEDENEPGAT